MAEFWSSAQHARTVGELKDSIRKVFGRTGLMSFLRFDHGAIVRKATGAISPGWSARHGHGRRGINGNEDQNRRETRDEHKETQHRLLPRNMGRRFELQQGDSPATGGRIRSNG